MSQMPDTIRQALAAIGPHFNPDVLERTRALYAPLVSTAGGVEEVHDLPYGSNARQKLDVYTPSRDGKRPVLVYVPGGGFTGGDKRSDERFYGNLGRWFARQGLTVVIVNYRLAPAYGYPAGAEDIRSALAWTWTNIGEYGGNQDQMFLFGQSAGASHAASCLFDPMVREAPNQPLGAILASGVYRMTAETNSPNHLAYFGKDASKYEARSPMTHVATSKVPLLLSLAEFDPIGLSVPTLELAAAVAARDGKTPQLFYQPHHNHVSTVLSFDTGDETFGRVILDFIRTCLSTPHA
jgi:triacylglycerol lipase